MRKEENPIYAHQTIEFVTVALEYCTMVENINNINQFDFINKAIKILPLLYLKATLLPQIEVIEDIELEQAVTENMYESVRVQIAELLGNKDSFLETFHTDIQYSDTPIISFISENLSDVYQDIGNFIFLFRQGNEEIMRNAIALCFNNFQKFCGQQLLNALKALHATFYNDEEFLDINEETKE